MTTVTAPTHGGLRWQFADALVMARRNLLRYVRLPQLLVFATVQPIMFVVLFAYVFGGAIDIPGVDYLDFLLPGILVQTVIFGSTQTGLGLADDLGSGAIDRFRSLPMTRSAVLAGRTLADTVRTTATVLLIAGVGALLGLLHPHRPAARHRRRRRRAAVRSRLLLGVRHHRAARQGPRDRPGRRHHLDVPRRVRQLCIRPRRHDAPLAADLRRPPADHRHRRRPARLVLGGPTAAAVAQSLAWSAGILAVFVPLAIARYRRLER